MNLIQWIKKLKSIVVEYDTEIRNLHARVVDMEKLVRDRTDIAVDVGFNGQNHVFVIGRYHNVDYIQTYTVEEYDFAALIDQLRNMERRGYGKVTRVDAPPSMRAAFKHRLNL